MFWPDDYLARVARQIRIERIREPLIGELRDHMLLQKEDYLREGLTEAEAEERATGDMGDALLVGGALDAAHRPIPQWKGLAMTALVLLIGLGLQIACDLFAGVSPGDIWQIGNPILAALALIPLCLFAFSDYTLWIHWSLPVFGLWLLMIVQRLWIWIAYQGGPMIPESFRFILYSPIFHVFVPQELAVALPTMSALLACRLRGRGPGALALCLLPPLALMLLCWEYRDSGYDPAACMLMGAAGLAALAMAVKDGFFRVRRSAARLLLGALIALALGFCAFRLSGSLQLRQSDIRAHMTALLHDARLLGSSAARTTEPELWQAWFANGPHMTYLLPTIILMCGWLPFFGLTLGGAALLIGCWRRFARLENAMGSLLGRIATLTLMLQAALYVPAAFGLIGENLCLPLLSYGYAMRLVDAALIGLMLGVLRGRSLPESPIPAKRLSATL